jgi:Ca2+-binding RTX toxin-like protein
MQRFATATVVLMSFAVPWAPAAAEPPTCNGLPATIVVSSGQTNVEGTDADDVIVATGGSHVVIAGAGNDTVCTANGDDDIYPGPGNDWAFAGAGHDTIWDDEGNDALDGGEGLDLLATDAVGPSFADLGTGILSGQGSDTMHRLENYRQTGLGSADVTTSIYSTRIETGSGSSTVTALGRVFSPLLSVVTGVGNDNVEVRRPGVSVSTHGGHDVVVVHDLEGTTHVVDDADGITVTGGTGVEDVQVSPRPGATGPVRLDLGGGNDIVDARASDLQIQTGPGSDTVAAGHLPSATNTGWVRLGGGADFFLLDGVPMGSMPQPVSAQSGRDTVIGTPYHDEIDLARIASWESGSSKGSVLIDGFEVANGQGELDKLWGTGGGDLLRGGAGDDILTGRGGDDVLLGGPGHDHGDGGPGTDKCSTEVRRNCER